MRQTRYKVSRGAIYGVNQGRFNNRPLYSNNSDDVVIGGDRPILHFGRNPTLHGSLLIGLRRNEVAFWLHDASEITVLYRAGRLSWEISDSRWLGEIFLDVVPVVGATGMAVRLRTTGSPVGAELIWAFGGAVGDVNPNAYYDAGVSEEITLESFLPETCSRNRVEIDGDHFTVSPAPAKDDKVGVSVGYCSLPSQFHVADALEWENPISLASSAGESHPLLCGTAGLPPGQAIYWLILGKRPSESIADNAFNSPEIVFTTGWERGENLARRVQVSTPEPRLDALASASVAAADGIWYPPVFVHGAMLWNMPFPGWRSIYAGTIYGWHDRVQETARYFIASQVTDSEKNAPEADASRLLSCQSENSRFHGRGRIQAHQSIYNMQTQCFDQLIHQWRATADLGLEAILRPALDLHLEWMQECFDPDEDGLYEDYIHCWPTDSVWNNGGGGTDTTSYAYSGHVAAQTMAERAGDARAAAFHGGRATRIKKNFFEKLWVSGAGHPGHYREQGGHERLHKDPWAYGLFLPIDADLVVENRAVTTLHYANSKLQNDHKPYGGRMVWNSNWVPAVWSVRTDWPGDNYALALANFQTGCHADGWDIFQGTFLSTAFENEGLGNLGHRAGGYDFADCVTMFARTLVEGLFGYVPDYPHGSVLLRPGFPGDWEHASLQIPDVRLAYTCKADTIIYEVELTRPAKMEIRLPVVARKIIAVEIDGVATAFELLAGIRCGLVQLSLSCRQKARVVIKIEEPFLFRVPLEIQGTPGRVFEYASESGAIQSLEDPQRLLAKSRISEGRLLATLGNNPGQHVMPLLIVAGTVPMCETVQVTIQDPLAESKRKEICIENVPENAKWQTLDLAPILNADVRTIFQQTYLTPRPDTVSLRIGTDGWSPWTSTFWGQKPPAISLDGIPSLLTPSGNLRTPQGAIFAWPGAARNIAFASLWDNYPTCVTLPVGCAGKGVWLLVAGSTNPMQCKIANAVVRLRYANGSEDSFDLVPPDNFWALAPLQISGSEPGQEGRHDYDDPVDSFAVPGPYPPQVQLGKNCRAMVYGRALRSNVSLQEITLEVLSQEVVIGLLAASIMR